MLQSLQVPYLLSQGYANIRCVWLLGCPSDLHGLDQSVQTDSDSEESAQDTKVHYKKAFQELFPGKPVPAAVDTPCCAQFAVTREAIQSRTLLEYQHYRQWLTDTPLADYVSGRVFEYCWHIIFGKAAVHCPNPKECYCNTFGLCELECEEDGCGERWPYPPSATLPDGWPTVGWEGQIRDKDFIEAQRNVAMINQTEASRPSPSTDAATALKSSGGNRTRRNSGRM